MEINCEHLFDLVTGNAINYVIALNAPAAHDETIVEQFKSPLTLSM
jgi:hypothetical protein